jgi:hypothetical protein
MTNPKVTLDGKEYEVAPLSLGQLRNGLLAKLREHDELANAGRVLETWIIQGEIIAEAIRRKSPELSVETITANLDLGQIHELWPVMLGLSGFKPGEIQPAAK